MLVHSSHQCMWEGYTHDKKGKRGEGKMGQNFQAKLLKEVRGREVSSCPLIGLSQVLIFSSLKVIFYSQRYNFTVSFPI